MKISKKTLKTGQFKAITAGAFILFLTAILVSYLKVQPKQSNDLSPIELNTEPQKVRISTYNKENEYCDQESISSIMAADQTVRKNIEACEETSSKTEKEECLSILSKNEIALTMMESTSCEGGTVLIEATPSPTLTPKLTQKPIQPTQRPLPTETPLPTPEKKSEEVCKEEMKKASAFCAVWLSSPPKSVGQGLFAGCIGKARQDYNQCMEE